MAFIGWQLAEMEISLLQPMIRTSLKRLTRAQLGVIPPARGLRQVQGQINAVLDTAPISTLSQPALMVQIGLLVLAMKGVYTHRVTLVWIGLTQMSVEPTLDLRSAQTALLGSHQIQMEACIEIPDLVGLRLPLQVCHHQRVGPALLAIQRVQKWQFLLTAERFIQHRIQVRTGALVVLLIEIQ